MNTKIVSEQDIESLLQHEKIWVLANDAPVIKDWFNALPSASSVIPSSEGEAVASGWMLNGVMVNAFNHPPQENWDHDGYWKAKGYSKIPLYTTPQLPTDEAARIAELEAERDRYKEAHFEWNIKTEWVQASCTPKELGLHRADAIHERIVQLQADRARLLDALTIAQPYIDSSKEIGASPFGGNVRALITEMDGKA